MRSAEDEIRDRLEEFGWPHAASAFHRWAEVQHPRGRGGVFVRSNRPRNDDVEARTGPQREKLEADLDKGLKKKATKTVKHRESARERHVRQEVRKLKPNEQKTISGTKITVSRTHHKTVAQYDVHDEETSRGKRRIVGKKAAQTEAAERQRVAFHGKEDPGTITTGEKAQEYEKDFAPARAGTAGETARAARRAAHDKTEQIAKGKEAYDRLQPEGASQDAVTPTIINVTPLAGVNKAFEKGIGADEVPGGEHAHAAHHTINHLLGKADPGTLHKVSEKAVALHHGAHQHMSGTGVKRHLAGKAAGAAGRAISDERAHGVARVVGHTVKHLVSAQLADAEAALERALQEGDARAIADARALCAGVLSVLREARFDPVKHPRGRGGHFVDVLAQLRSGEHKHFPGGIKVQKTSGGWTVESPRMKPRHFGSQQVDHAAEYMAGPHGMEDPGTGPRQPTTAHVRKVLKKVGLEPAQKTVSSNTRQTHGMGGNYSRVSKAGFETRKETEYRQKKHQPTGRVEVDFLQHGWMPDPAKAEADSKAAHAALEAAGYDVQRSEVGHKLTVGPLDHVGRDRRDRDRAQEAADLLNSDADPVDTLNGVKELHNGTYGSGRYKIVPQGSRWVVQEAAHPVPFDPAAHPRGRAGRFIRDAYVRKAAPLAQMRLDRTARSVGVPVDQYANALSKHLAKLLKDAKVNIRVPDDSTLEAILRYGEYLPSPVRKEVETPIFGETPVYGYLTGVKGESTVDDGAHKYGYDRIVLKDAVRERTTVTVGDSLVHLTSRDIIPAWINDPRPTPLSVADPATVFPPYDALMIGDVNPPTLRNVHAPDYFEAQVHGGVQTSDIDHVVLAQPPGDSLRAVLERRNIPWRQWSAKGLTEAFDPGRHPRGRAGRWAEVLGKMDPGTSPATTIGATPFRGKEDPGTSYFDTPTFKGYENRVGKEADNFGLTVTGIDKVSGVWGGGGEPSSQVFVGENDPAKVTSLMDRIGGVYNQDGVIAFIPGEGKDVRITTDSIVDPSKAIKELGKYDKIPGATVRKDGRLELIHMPGSYDSERDAAAAEAQMVEFLQGLGVGFDYEQGQGILRLAERDYQRRGNKRILEARLAIRAALEGIWSPQEEGLEDQHNHAGQAPR